jgi:hypothetical protein
VVYRHVLIPIVTMRNVAGTGLIVGAVGDLLSGSFTVVFC